ncbi:hypothetical protein AGMMS50239_21760 [Bacteroidia bacterium]|nr:hypothetical protein AGMMS50239_21760 [Bacteroidia bacterium]
MNDQEPDYVKASIYNYLKDNGNFTYFTRIIDMVEEDGIKYSEVLGKTGSKTLFVANDEAFEAFFKDNEYGIRRFEDFSLSQCRSILFGGMLNNPYLLAMLTYLPGSPPAMGQVMRREASLPLLDTVLLKRSNDIPDNPYWKPYKEKGIYLLDDRTNYTLVHFLPVHMRMQGITDEDFYTMTHVTRSSTDAYLFDIKIVEPDIICKNGYIHRLEKLLLPRESMAEYVRSNPEISKFNGFLERYSCPIYDAENTNAYKRVHPGFQDSIFVKWFFNSQEQPGTWTDNTLLPKNVNAYLKYNPGKKSYQLGSNSIQGDMAAMFVPTDAALENYFNSDAGRTLKERYQSWDNVPDNVLDVLINHHMQQSFLQATPSRFVNLADNMGTPMDAKPADVNYSKICSNGIIYVTDVVYAPTRYVAVTAPVLMGAKTTLFNWIVNQLQFDLYLLSMEPGNRFSFFVPTDEVFQNYVDPGSVANGKPEFLHFYIDPKNNAMMASRWDVATGDSLGVYTSAFSEKPSEKAKNYLDYLLLDIMDNHIVLQDIEPGKQYYRTKAGGTVVVTGQGGNLKVAGGANMSRSETISVTTAYNMKNGNTYLIDKVLQMPLVSTYSELGKQDEYSEFFELCFDVKEIIEGAAKVGGGRIFGGNGKGIDENVRFFNTFHYTVYVPANTAIRQAIADGLIMRWNDIEALRNTDYSRYLREATNLYDFLSYHFQDNSVYVSDKLDGAVEYETANLERNSAGNLTGKFSKLKIFADGTNLSVQGIGNQTPVKVNTSNPLFYNRMVRDYQFTTNLSLSTSSFAVIHQIDGVLEYKKR